MYKFENQDEMDNFLRKYNAPKITSVNIESMNRPVSAEEIDIATKKQPHKKAPDLDGFTGEFN